MRKKESDIKEVKEIHKTEFIDKQLPTIYYEYEEYKNMTESKRITISVSDKTSTKAMDTFTKIKEKIKE